MIKPTYAQFICKFAWQTIDNLASNKTAETSF